MRWLLVLLALVGCRDDAKPRRNAQTGSAVAKAAPDPWSVQASADDIPNVAERHQLAETACPRVTGPYFFAVEKAGKVSHILGTRHVGVGIAKFPDVVRDRFAEATLAVFEVPPGEDAHVERPDLDLASELGPELWNHYKKIVGPNMAASMEHGRPSGALLGLMVLHEDLSSMLDMELERLADEQHKATGGLESSAFQDAVLDELLDMRMLRATLNATKSRQKLREESLRDLHDYCAGTDDKPGMDDEMRADLIANGYSKDELDAMDDRLVFARNRSWIPKLEKLFEQPHVFVAVGADHLTGEQGVVSLLRKRGFTVTRLGAQ